MVPFSIAINKEKYSDKMKLFLLVSSFFVVSFGACNQCSDSYSWTIDRPLVDYSKDASRWQQNNILSKANYAQRKGPRRPMVRIAKDLIEKHFRPSETRRDAKQIAIVVTSVPS